MNSKIARTLVSASVLALVGCAPSRARSATTTTSGTESRVARERASEASADVSIHDAALALALSPRRVTVSDLEACDEACSQRTYPAISAALAVARSEPRRALAALRVERSRVAHAWAAVVALDLGDRDALNEETALLRATDEEGATPDPNVSQRTSLLREVRLALDHESEEARASVVPCWVFERYGHEGLDAFTGFHGSTLDVAARSLKRQCLDELVSRAGTSAEQARFRAAFDALEGGVFSVIAVPTDGTMWVGLSIGATDVLYDAALAPETISASTDSIAASVRVLSRTHRGLAARVRAFERRQQQHLPAFADGLCAHARALGRSMTPEACARSARSASDAALARWLRALNHP